MGVANLSGVSRSAGEVRGLQDLTLDGNSQPSNGFGSSLGTLPGGGILMPVTHYARRSLAAAVLALALAACGKSSGPSEFNPQGTSADMTAAQDAFVSQQSTSFAAVGPDISAVLNGSPMVASSAALALTRPSASSAGYARMLASL